MIKIIKILFFCCIFSKIANAETNINIPNCDYLITFPGKPSLNDLFLSENIVYKQAEYYGDEFYLKAECIPFRVIGKEQLKNLMFNFGRADGLNNMQLKSGFDKTGEWLKLRGYKKIGNDPVTYEIKAYYSSNSLIVMYAGTLSNKYPTNEIGKFLFSGAKLK
jgi:hypothetical protein